MNLTLLILRIQRVLRLKAYYELNCVCHFVFIVCSGRTQREALEDGKKIQRPDPEVKRYEFGKIIYMQT